MSGKFVKFNEYINIINNTEEFDSESKLSSGEAFDFATIIHEIGHCILQNIFWPGSMILTEWFGSKNAIECGIDISGHMIPHSAECITLIDNIKNIMVSLAGREAVSIFFGENKYIKCKDGLKSQHINSGYSLDYDYARQDLDEIFSIMQIGRNQLDSAVYHKENKEEIFSQLRSFTSTILLENKDLLMALVELLMEKHAISNLDLKELIKEYPLVHPDEELLIGFLPELIKPSLASDPEYIAQCYHIAGHVVVKELLYGPGNLGDINVYSEINSNDLIQNSFIPNPRTVLWNDRLHRASDAYYSDTICGAIDVAGIEAVKLFMPLAESVADSKGENSFKNFYEAFYKNKHINIGPKAMNKALKQDRALTEFFVDNMLKENEEFVKGIANLLIQKSSKVAPIMEKAAGIISNEQDLFELEKDDLTAVLRCIKDNFADATMLTKADIDSVREKCNLSLKAAEAYTNFMFSYADNPIAFTRIRESILSAK